MSLYVRYWDTKNLSSECRGIITEHPTSEDTILWKKKNNRPWMTFLIREVQEEAYRSDCFDTLFKIQKEHETGVMLANLLITVVENGQHIDYLKGYVEILD